MCFSLCFSMIADKHKALRTNEEGRASSSVGRACASHAQGHVFDSRVVHALVLSVFFTKKFEHKKTKIIKNYSLY